jgi:hypothetical protein
MTRVRLDQKGLDLTARIDQLYRRNAEEISGRIAEDQLDQVNKSLQSLERYWSNLVSYSL